MAVKFYYGLSGTFKTSTIKVEKELSQNTAIVWSMIKRWKDLESGIYQGQTMITDLNFAMLHLCNLENVVKNGVENIIVERGITDMAYYWLRTNTTWNDDVWIKESVKKELDLCGNNQIEKILLVQNDVDFIRDVVLKEKTRAAVFPGGVDEYLEEQQKYIEFTEKYNKITKIIKIDNSQDYLKSLGLNLEV